MQIGTVGEESQTYTEYLDQTGVERFSRAISYSGSDLPPTWFTRLRRGEFELFERFSIPLASVLHAEQRYILERPIQISTELSYVTRFVQSTEKASGSRGTLTFIVFETEVQQEGKRCATARTTVAVRSGT